MTPVRPDFPVRPDRDAERDGRLHNVLHFPEGLILATWIAEVQLVVDGQPRDTGLVEDPVLVALEHGRLHQISSGALQAPVQSFVGVSPADGPTVSENSLLVGQGNGILAPL